MTEKEALDIVGELYPILKDRSKEALKTLLPKLEAVIDEKAEDSE